MPNQPNISAIVINLANSVGRLRFQEAQLSHLNIAFERFAAISTADVTDADYDKWSSDWQRKLRRTEVACFLSHYSVWQTIAQSNKPYLVLEDDAMLSNHLPAALNAIQHLATDDFDHISLETRGRKKLIGNQAIYLTEQLTLQPLYLDKSGAAAYILTPKGAQTLLNEVDRRGAGLADAILCHTQALKSLQAVPALAFQMDMASHFGMQDLVVKDSALSNISTSKNPKPKDKGLAININYKLKRMNAQLDRAAKRIKYIKSGSYGFIEISKEDFSYFSCFLKN
ncbi:MULTISPECIES: glycosyltransferase family 25 protein [Psychrobacter]|uniref:glycosyltransferase family 25 protein n=1 Tax=Psychrobacter TaxID=497 RepID=UPI00146F4AB0|nr:MULTISPECIES: glycosyltransferase family 25 protein [Psychrobacter]